MSFPFPCRSRAVIGVVHLPALPGSPGHQLSRSQIMDHALTDAEALIAGGVSGIIIENFGDAPFYPEEVPKSTIADMTVIVQSITARSSSIPIGVNVLRNDASAALAIAAACNSSFIRVNVHTAAMLTDQGWIEGQAHHTLRERRALSADSISIAADVGVKHALRPAGFNIAQAAKDVTGRGHAGAVIVTGASTGSAADLDELQQVREAVPQTPVLVGSGVDTQNIHAILDLADGVIVGTSLKKDGLVNSPVEIDRVRALVETAKS
ncbi:hypothetical protein CBD41_02390 [bacterium TMED181]|nr:phosphorybosylanthranilate isomerase [Planctomycetota bacterium]OUW46553.1 MAG: hypothetical protein CBD41_02390 [bacterium TMED181]